MRHEQALPRERKFHQRCEGPKWWKEHGKLKNKTRNPLSLEQCEEKNHELRLKRLSAECWEDKVSAFLEALQKFMSSWPAMAALWWSRAEAAQAGRPVTSSPATNQRQHNTMVT